MRFDDDSRLRAVNMEFYENSFVTGTANRNRLRVRYFFRAEGCIPTGSRARTRASTPTPAACSCGCRWRASASTSGRFANSTICKRACRMPPAPRACRVPPAPL
jgi:hypothetical protein